MLKKRMNTIGVYKECDESKRDRNCLNGEMKSQEMADRRFVSNPRSKFWKSLLENVSLMDKFNLLLDESLDTDILIILFYLGSQPGYQPRYLRFGL